jgi:hypothetical protein
MKRPVVTKRIPRAALQYVYDIAFSAPSIDRLGEPGPDERRLNQKLAEALEVVRKHFHLRKGDR